MQPASVISEPLESAPKLIGGRYKVEHTLGQGGMAIVYQVLDSSSGRGLALKRLRVPKGTDKQKEFIALFEREFFTLASLSHPRVVTVYDYGVDDDGPYYTMELLDGGDLQRLAPLDWQKACALARDVCSTLSLLHSRRMVYRDLSPRNVRCTSDGLAKLIDFGAMAPMGPSRQIVGTLPFCAPEVIHCLPLDARTDLYALGATLYYTLVGQHAFPARNVSQLHDLWESRPRAPSEIVSGIPKALDELIADLLQMEPAARPASAAEVMERLSAIAELPLAEHLLVSQAYLSAPTLVGRDMQIARVRRIMTRARHRRGQSFAISGPAGIGRSRLLDSCVLEAKLAGSIVLRADATDAQNGDYGVVRALAVQLLEALPEPAAKAAEPRLSLLGHVVPELVQGRDVALVPIDDPEQLASLVQPELRSFLLELGRERSIVLAIDDLQQSDEPSLSLVALLAQKLSQHAIVIAATIDSFAAGASKRPALDLFRESSAALQLEPLTLQQIEAVLGSVFGDVPNVQHLAHRLYAISRGNPRDTMQLAQHLVDNGAVRYQAGGWSIPEHFDAAELPSSMAQALRMRIEALNPDARRLACTLAFEPSQRFTFEECLALTAHQKPALLMQSLDELIRSEIVQSAGRRYALLGQSLGSVLTHGLDSDQEREAHAKLAEVFAARGDGLRLAEHLLRAGERERALDALVAHAESSERLTDASPKAFAEFLASVPANWLATYELGIRLCEELGRPKAHAFQIRARVCGMQMIAVMDADTSPIVAAYIAQLHHDCGLDLYATLDESMPAPQRLQRCLELAGQRYASMSPAERVFEPLAAIRRLGQATVTAVGQVAFTYNYALWKRLPSLAPLAPLSPVLEFANRLRHGVGLRITGHSEQALELYRALIERMLEPDHAGLDASHLLHTRLRITGTVGLLEAAMGLKSSLEWAQELESQPMYETNAVMIRLLYHLWHGDRGEAERCRRQAEMLRIQISSRSTFEGPHLLGEVCACSLAEDLMGVKRTLPALEPIARIHAGWVPVLHYARGEYQRIRGNYAGALREFEAALGAMEPACHQIWPNAAGAHVRTLLELGRNEEARSLGERYLQLASENDLGYVRNYVRMPLALAQSRIGNYESALVLAQAAIESFTALGLLSLNLAVAYETRARIALDMRDEAAFDEYAALCAAELPRAAHRLHAAKQRSRLHFEDEGPLGSEETHVVHESVIESRLSQLLADCEAQERMRRALEMLVRQSGAVGGLLYTIRDKRLERAAELGDVQCTPELEALIHRYFEGETDDREVTQSVVESDALSVHSMEWIASSDARYVPVVLSHPCSAGTALTGMAVLLVKAAGQFVYPSRLASELSRLLLAYGSSIPIYV